jgi:heme exporter protein C
VVAILGALNIPLVHFSVYWWRTLHQPPSVLRPGGVTMPEAILAVLLVNLGALALLAAYFIAKRVTILRAEAEALA